MGKKYACEKKLRVQDELIEKKCKPGHFHVTLLPGVQLSVIPDLLSVQRSCATVLSFLLRKLLGRERELWESAQAGNIRDKKGKVADISKTVETENWHLKDSRNNTHMKGHKILTRKKKGKSEDSSSALPQISLFSEPQTPALPLPEWWLLAHYTEWLIWWGLI